MGPFEAHASAVTGIMLEIAKSVMRIPVGRVEMSLADVTNGEPGLGIEALLSNIVEFGEPVPAPLALALWAEALYFGVDPRYWEGVMTV